MFSYRVDLGMKDLGMPRSNKPPAFQFYPADFLSDENVALMSLAARGAYITLLSHCWLQGSVPIESDKCWHLCHDPTMGFDAWADIWCQVEPCFTENGNGRLVHPRLEAEREKQAEWREKSRRGGIESGKARRVKSKGGSRVVQPKANRTVEPNANTSSSSSTSSSSTSIVSPSGETRRTKGSPDPRVDAVFRMYEWARREWLQSTGRRASTLTLTPKRRRLILEALKVHGQDKCEKAARGIFLDPWNNGTSSENKEGKEWLDLELALRMNAQRDNVEHFAGLVDE